MASPTFITRLRQGLNRSIARILPAGHARAPQDDRMDCQEIAAPRRDQPPPVRQSQRHARSLPVGSGECIVSSV